MLRRWRGDGAIDDRDEAALARHYDERQDQVREELDAIVPEYRRRVHEEGAAQAGQWLRDTAREMGRRDGEATRRMLESLPR